MQVVILAGGFGTRLSEETDMIPKPMVRLDNDPLIVHLIRYFVNFGHRDFIVATGYKGNIIQEYFQQDAKKTIGRDCRVTAIDTGLNTQTGGRLLRLKSDLDQEFFLTYGDGLSNVDLDLLLDQHRTQKKLATVTAVRPPARFGTLELAGLDVVKFSEKDPQEVGWINGGFFCLDKKVCDFIDGDDMSLESTPMDSLVRVGQLGAFRHFGFWHPMDTLRDKRELSKLLENGNAPWMK